jgi:uncharacterized surface protein with fasciclin (FAS1) repeats
MSTSEYRTIISTAKRHRGRPRLTEEERAIRAEQRKVANRLKQEARRRASIVLQHRHSEEFSTLLKAEYEALIAETTSVV